MIYIEDLTKEQLRRANIRTDNLAAYIDRHGHMPAFLQHLSNANDIIATYEDNRHVACICAPNEGWAYLRMEILSGFPQDDPVQLREERKEINDGWTSPIERTEEDRKAASVKRQREMRERLDTRSE